MPANQPTSKTATIKVVPEHYWDLLAAYSFVAKECFTMPHWLKFTRHRFFPLFPAAVVNYFVTRHVDKSLRVLKAHFNTKLFELKSDSCGKSLPDKKKQYDEAIDAIEKLEASLPNTQVNKWVVILAFIGFFCALVYLTNLIFPLTNPEVNAAAALASGIYTVNGPDILKAVLDENMFAVYQKMIVPLFLFTFLFVLIIYHFNFKRWLFNYPKRSFCDECSFSDLQDMGASKKTGVYALERRVFSLFSVKEPSEWQLDLLACVVMDVVLVAIAVYIANKWWLIVFRTQHPLIFLGASLLFSS